MAAVAELESTLVALRALKPPGVTKSRISSITLLCVENVKSESVLVQKIYTTFKKTPATHKLGVLYVIDSVTRQWIERANATGEDLTAASATDGTFSAGVKRMTELLPLLMNDMVQNVPEDQKEKAIKLIDIWERGNVFPGPMLQEYKVKLENRVPKPVENTTPLQGTPEMSAATPAQVVAPALNKSSAELLASLTRGTQQNGQSQPQPQAQLPAQPQGQPAAAGPQGLSTDQMAVLSNVIPAHIFNDPAALSERVQLLQQLMALNVPQENWPIFIENIEATKRAGQQPSLATQVPQTQSVPRERSRSPMRTASASQYRQRSPPRKNSPSQQQDTIPLAEKWIGHDSKLPSEHIKVLSRTLFVGGTTSSEQELKYIFSRFGNVQTVIANPEKRHAFVKMCTRAEALAARDGMETITDPELQAKMRSVRWGVGFGPRDCSDYQQGVSIIPIERLTEADRKWVLTAEFGGTGGRQMETGMIFEEPDIEIGAGVSSKAISRRMQGAELRAQTEQRSQQGRRSGPQDQAKYGYQQPQSVGGYMPPQGGYNPPPIPYSNQPPMPHIPQMPPQFGYQMPPGHGGPPGTGMMHYGP